MKIGDNETDYYKILFWTKEFQNSAKKKVNRKSHDQRKGRLYKPEEILERKTWIFLK